METVKYKDIPKGYCFTFKDAVLVYYEDTQRGETKRTFHSYKKGDLYQTSATIFNKDNDFYMCDKYGAYIPLAMIIENKALREEVKKLKNRIFTPTLSTGYMYAIKKENK